MEFACRVGSMIDERFFAVAILTRKRNMPDPFIQEISGTIAELVSDLVEKKSAQINRLNRDDGL